MMKLIAINTVSIILAIGAVCIAVNGNDGWGWFIFGSFCTFCYPKKA